MAFDLDKAKEEVAKVQAGGQSAYAKFRALPRNVQIGIVVAALMLLAYLYGRWS